MTGVVIKELNTRSIIAMTASGRRENYASWRVLISLVVVDLMVVVRWFSRYGAVYASESSCEHGSTPNANALLVLISPLRRVQKSFFTSH